MASLVAVNLGLRSGLALFLPVDRLAGYRSRDFGARAALHRDAHGLLDVTPDVTPFVLEGAGPIAAIGGREPEHRKLASRRTSAKDWRERFFDPRDHRISPGYRVQRNSETCPSTRSRNPPWPPNRADFPEEVPGEGRRHRARTWTRSPAEH